MKGFSAQIDIQKPEAVKCQDDEKLYEEEVIHPFVEGASFTLLPCDWNAECVDSAKFVTENGIKVEDEIEKKKIQSKL